MTWLFPLYLLGAGAVIAPILMHLRRRPPQDRVEFSSLMFLDARTPLPVSRRRLENWLLLLLRCLVLIVLVLMFARPVWRPEEVTPAGSGTATLFLLDVSASMRRGSLWPQTKDVATRRLRGLQADDRAAVAAFDRDLRLLWSFEEDGSAAGTRTAAATQRLAPLEPGWDSTDLGAALVEACDIFSRSKDLRGLKKRIVLLSDLQDGARLEALASRVWPENITLEVFPLELPGLDNITLSLAAEDPAVAMRGDAAARTRLRITNNRGSGVTDFRLDTTPPVTGHLPPGASRVISIPAPAQAVTLGGDTADFDNRVFITPPQPRPVKIAFIGDDRTRNEAASPLFYLSRALQPTPALLPELSVVPESAPALPAGLQVLFMTGHTPRAGLTDFLKSGGLVVAVITEKTTGADLESLTGLASASWKIGPSRTGSAEDYAMLAEVQTAHPLLRPFADERLRDFTKLRFWHHRSVSVTGEGAGALTVLARFDDGDPAMLAMTRPGGGTVLLLTSGWQPADSQLALSTKFVPLLYGWLEAAGFRNERAASLLVGDMLPGEDLTSITLPDGGTQAVKAGAPAMARMPGIHTLGRNGEKPLRIAVNIAPEEGRITPLGVTRLRELGVKVEEPASATMQPAGRERLALNEEESRQRAWLWLLMLLLALLAGETWLAGRTRPSILQPA